VTASSDTDDDPISQAEGLSLLEYVEICRALIRHGAGSERLIGEVLVGHGMTPDRWASAHSVWTERIRRDPDIRSEFQRLYAGPPPADFAAGNE
jgi:hypothetical protein